MKTTLIAALALFATAAAVIAPSANATDFCNGNGTVVSIADQAYVAADAVMSHGYLFSLWIYLESNGATGLQRGGVTLLGDADICQDSATPDTGVF